MPDTLSFDPIPQSLEQVRSKLQQLTTSLQALQHRILSGAPLPPWPQVQSSISVVLSQISSLTDTLAKNEEELKSLAVYPDLIFPIATHEGLLTTLIRSKPLPESEEWISRAQADGESLEALPMLTFPMNEDKMDLDEDEPNVNDEYSVSEWLAAQKARRQWTGYYTKKEIDDAFEIEKEDLDDLRRLRQSQADRAMLELKTMIKFARTGR